MKGDEVKEAARYGRHLREVCERHDALPEAQQRVQARRNRRRKLKGKRA
ncbi:MAG TPA: hypothetical protein VFJ76_07920 [Solirubrobacterales bacterium]|nr:hypothetical protein [Solirubrobacterales bacterium]